MGQGHCEGVRLPAVQPSPPAPLPKREGRFGYMLNTITATSAFRLGSSCTGALASVSKRNLPANLETLLAAELLEVGNGQRADVRGVVPLEAVFGVNPRGAALFGQFGPQLAIGDVRKTDDAAAADPQHVAEHARGVENGLQRLRKHNDVELAVGEGRQSFVQVGLHHIQPAADASHDRLLVPFDAHDLVMLALAEPGQKFAAAAAEIEHARFRRNQIEDRVVIQSAVLENAGVGGGSGEWRVESGEWRGQRVGCLSGHRRIDFTASRFAQE